MNSLLKIFILALILTVNFEWTHQNELDDWNGKLISNKSMSSNLVKSKRDRRKCNSILVTKANCLYILVHFTF